MTFVWTGVFEGKTLSLLHPVMMVGMLTLSASTALLGFEWRRQRTIGDDISALKKQMPKLDGASSVSEALKACQSSEEIDSSQLARLESALPIESEIKELQTERKTLAGK
jgi:Xaa-Pro aminopeptidase